MNPDALAANARVLAAEIEWFRAVLDLRLRLHAGEGDRGLGDPLETLPPPPLPVAPAADATAPYARVVTEAGLDGAERLVLLLALLPHLKPDALDLFFLQNRSLERRFTEFGGVPGVAHGGLLPTGETALFLLAGEDLGRRLGYRHVLQPDHPLFRRAILRLESRQPGEPALAALLQLTPEYVERLTTGRSYDPPLSPEFPAQRLTTPYEWADLVLDDGTRDEVEDILAWARHRRTLLDDWGLARRLKPGFRALFHGPPGTGKTLTAALLGKATGLGVYRIDLSKVVSKYIGETEKNLASLFDHAEHRDWILFFDEADSLFGKRTESRNSNDRAANQQVSYLLQRIEDFPGIVILATNLRSHLDEAFARRFQSIIHFALPNAAERLRLWQGLFDEAAHRLAADVDLAHLAETHELAGGSLLNVMRFACLRAVVREPAEIRLADLQEGIDRELRKEGKFAGRAGS
ncbi:MAG: ATP-binding protein [Thermoanaerobaculia bacterium]|nr:ATP-binding protein [Thermoanaerobaculia bacterium]